MLMLRDFLMKKHFNYLMNCQKKLDTIDPGIVNYIVPIRSGETRIECINPDLLTGEAYVEATEAVEKLKEAVKNTLKNE